MFAEPIGLAPPCACCKTANQIGDRRLDSRGVPWSDARTFPALRVTFSYAQPIACPHSTPSRFNPEETAPHLLLAAAGADPKAPPP